MNGFRAIHAARTSLIPRFIALNRTHHCISVPGALHLPKNSPSLHVFGVRHLCSLRQKMKAENKSLVDYFACEWRLSKRMDYGPSGGKATFEGVAQFVKVAPAMLWYKEQGTMKLANGAVRTTHLFPFPCLPASSLLLWHVILLLRVFFLVSDCNYRRQKHTKRYTTTLKTIWRMYIS